MTKLVRDKIPELIEKSGKVAVTKTADKAEYWELLKEKLKEECKEFIKSESKEEPADVLEVIYAICSFRNWNVEEIEKLRIQKRLERGGFEKRICLLAVREK